MQDQRGSNDNMYNCLKILQKTKILVSHVETHWAAMKIWRLEHTKQHGRASYLRAMLQFKLVEESPSISQVRLNLHSSEEPLSGFGDLTLTPKQPEMWAQDYIWK